MQHVCVYCGSSPGARPEYAAAARDCGRLLAERGLTLVYGGGNVGLMNVLADAALAAGGTVIGVMPRHLIAHGVAHQGLSQLIAVDSMHERKKAMADRADAFLALPGGVGTAEEVLEVFTWLQLGLHRKPVGLVNVAGYYDGLLAFFRHMHAERFLKAEHLQMLLVASDSAALLNQLTTFVPGYVGKWLDRAETNAVG